MAEFIDNTQPFKLDFKSKNITVTIQMGFDLDQRGFGEKFTAKTNSLGKGLENQIERTLSTP